MPKKPKISLLIGGERGWPDEAAARQSAGSDHGHLPLTRQDQRGAHRLPHGHQAIRVHRVGEFQSELSTVKISAFVLLDLWKRLKRKNVILTTKRDIYVVEKCHDKDTISSMFGFLPGSLSICFWKIHPVWAGPGGGIVGGSFNWKIHTRIHNTVSIPTLRKQECPPFPPPPSRHSNVAKFIVKIVWKTQIFFWTSSFLHLFQPHGRGTDERGRH